MIEHTCHQVESSARQPSISAPVAGQRLTSQPRAWSGDPIDRGVNCRGGEHTRVVVGISGHVALRGGAGILRHRADHPGGALGCTGGVGASQRHPGGRTNLEGTTQLPRVRDRTAKRRTSINFNHSVFWGQRWSRRGWEAHGLGQGQPAAATRFMAAR